MKANSLENLTGKSLNDISLEELDKYVAERKLNDKVSTKRSTSRDDVLEEKLDRVDEKRNDIKFRIINNYGPLSDRKYAPIFTKIDWHGYERFDVRGWDAEMKMPKKGISFTEEELTSILSSVLPEECGLIKTGVFSGGKAKATIFENVCCLSVSTVKDETWTKEVNVINWGYGLKIDMRKWTTNHEKCGKGICITFGEFEKLKELAGGLLNR